MVDLGWSWWVTTLIAAGVALLAALAFVRTRRATVRAVAALILLEAIAIGIVAPFVMKSHENTGGTSAMSSAETDFARKADVNCSALAAYIGTLGNPTTPRGNRAQARQGAARLLAEDRPTGRPRTSAGQAGDRPAMDACDGGVRPGHGIAPHCGFSGRHEGHATRERQSDGRRDAERTVLEGPRAARLFPVAQAGMP